MPEIRLIFNWLKISPPQRKVTEVILASSPLIPIDVFACVCDHNSNNKGKRREHLRSRFQANVSLGSNKLIKILRKEKEAKGKEDPERKLNVRFVRGGKS